MSKRARATLVAHILFVIAGGYGAAAALVAGLAVFFPHMGFARSEAVVLASLLGFLIYLALLLWGFSERRPKRIVISFTFMTAAGSVFAAFLPHAGG